MIAASGGDLDTEIDEGGIRRIWSPIAERSCRRSEMPDLASRILVKQTSPPSSELGSFKE